MIQLQTLALFRFFRPQWALLPYLRLKYPARYLESCQIQHIFDIFQVYKLTGKIWSISMEISPKKQKIESAWTSHTIQLKDPPGTPTMSEVIFYSIISDDSQVVTPTESSIFAVNPEGVYTCSRLGLIPRTPLLLLLSVAGKQYVLEVSTKQQVYGLYSDKQIRNAKTKMKVNRIPSAIKRKAAAVAENILGIKRAMNRPMMPVHNFLRLAATLTKKVPSGTKTASMDIQKIKTGISNVLTQLEQAQTMRDDLLKLTGKDRAPPDELLSQLEDKLVQLYSSDYQKHRLAFADELKAYKPTRALALDRCFDSLATSKAAKKPDAAAQQRIHQRLDNLSTKIKLISSSLAKMRGSSLNMVLDMVCHPRSVFSQGIKPYAVTRTDVLETIGIGENAKSVLNATALSIAAIRRKTFELCQGLQLVLSTRAEPSPFHGVVSTASWLKDISGALQSADMGFRKTKRECSVDIHFNWNNIVSKKQKEKWMQFQKAMVNTIQSSDFCRSARDIKAQLHLLIGSVSRENKSGKQTDLSNWSQKSTQTTLVSHLKWIWLFTMQVVRGFNGTDPDQFITIVLESALGDDLIKSFIGWWASVLNRIKAKAQTSDFVKPNICTRPKKNVTADSMVYGDPFELGIEALWSQHLSQWPEEPSDTMNRMACARDCQLIMLLCIANARSCRPHIADEVCIVSQEQFDALAPHKWQNHQLRYGFWIIISEHHGQMTRVRIFNNDSKANVAMADGTINMHLEKKYSDNDRFDTIVFDANKWKAGYGWMKAILPRFIFAYNVLTPANRLYTSSIKDGKTFLDVPIYTMPTATSPLANQHFLRLDNQKYSGNYATAIAKAQKACGISRAVYPRDFQPEAIARQKKAGVTIVRCPPHAGTRDFTVAIGQKQSTAPWVGTSFTKRLAQIYTGKVVMDSSYRLVYDLTKKRKRNVVYAFNPFDVQCLKTQPKLFGRLMWKNGEFEEHEQQWTAQDIASLQELTAGCAGEGFICKFSAPRHCEISKLYMARDILKQFAGQNHPILVGMASWIDERKIMECHISDAVILSHYCKHNIKQDLCNIKYLRQHTADRLKGHPYAPKFDIAKGIITQWPTGLIGKEQSDETLWERAKSFKKLTISEQIKSLHHFACIRVFVEYLMTQYARFQAHPELVPMWQWVRSLSQNKNS